MMRRHGGIRRPGPAPSDPAFWRGLRAGSAIVLRADHPAEQGRRRDLEVVAQRHVSVSDGGGLRAEYLLLDVRSGESFHSVVATVIDARLSVTICGVLEEASSRDELAAGGCDWLFEPAAGEPQYARFPTVPLVPGGREPGVPFAASFAGPLRGEYAAAGSDRAASLTIVEYAALQPCDTPVLVVLDESEAGRVTVLLGRHVDPRQFEG